MSNLYFGQDCQYFVGGWETEDKDIEDYKNKIAPLLVLCTHPDNPEFDIEGNCNKDNCPLRRK